MSELVLLREQLEALDKRYIVAHSSYMQAIAKQDKAAEKARHSQRRLMQAIDTNTETPDMLEALRQLRKEEIQADDLVGQRLEERQALYFEGEALRSQIKVMEKQNVA
jgi:predicted lipase